MLFSELLLLQEKGCLIFFGEGSEEKERRMMVCQPCKCILRFSGSRKALLCIVFSSKKDSAARPCSLNKASIWFWLLRSYNLWNLVATQGGIAPLQLTQSDRNKMQQIYLYKTEITRFFPRSYKERVYEQGAVFLVSLYLQKSIGYTLGVSKLCKF